MNYKESIDLFHKSNGGLTCICGKDDRWGIEGHMSYPGDMEPEGTGVYYLKCMCGVTVPTEIAAAQLKKESGGTASNSGSPKLCRYCLKLYACTRSGDTVTECREFTWTAA